jgi:integrase/recombinase XerD
LLEFLGRKQITELEDVRPRHLRDLMKEKQDAGNTPRYINDLLKVWRTWFNYLVEEGYLEERDNPAKKVKPLRQPRTIIDTFTAAEMKRMIQFYDGKDFLEVRNKTIIMLLFDTGMRCNEMILMEPEDIKPDYILVKHGKGGKERVVPKSPALSKQLIKYCALRDFCRERPDRAAPKYAGVQSRILAMLNAAPDKCMVSKELQRLVQEETGCFLRRSGWPFPTA